MHIGRSHRQFRKPLSFQLFPLHFLLIFDDFLSAEERIAWEIVQSTVKETKKVSKVFPSLSGNKVYQPNYKKAIKTLVMDWARVSAQTRQQRPIA